MCRACGLQMLHILQCMVEFPQELSGPNAHYCCGEETLDHTNQLKTYENFFFTFFKKWEKYAYSIVIS